MQPEWIVLSMGHISRNNYWGEPSDRSFRDPLCTCTVIKTDDDIIVVDPCQKDMQYLMDSRCGLTVGDVTKVFVTHSHFDHWEGIACFPNAKCYMVSEELDALRRYDAKAAEYFLPVGKELVPGIQVIPLPGHTLTLSGLLFEAAEGNVVITGDGVMTRDYFINRRGYHNSVDLDLASQTIEHLSQIADVIVPGHDNYFLVSAAEKSPHKTIVITK